MVLSCFRHIFVVFCKTKCILHMQQLACYVQNWCNTQFQHNLSVLPPSFRFWRGLSKKWELGLFNSLYVFFFKFFFIDLMKLTLLWFGFVWIESAKYIYIYIYATIHCTVYICILHSSGTLQRWQVACVAFSLSLVGVQRPILLSLMGPRSQDTLCYFLLIFIFLCNVSTHI